MNIEEIAFKDRTELAHLNGIDLLNIIEFLQKDRQQWINQFSKTHNESVGIRTKNRQLKHNWDLLKICLKDVMNSYDEDNKEDKDFIREILDMMQELEQGGNVDERRRKRSNERVSL